MKKRLVLIRHAHRDTDQGRGLDNGLSSKGQQQAKALDRLLRKYKKVWSTPIELYSSPKKRCLETMVPLSESLQLEVKADPLLDEFQRLKDTQNVEEFLNAWLRSKASTWMVCSHGDWIPEFLAQNFQLETRLKKAGFAVIAKEADRLRLDSLVQRVVF